jgi:hypothetical protein
MSRLHVKRTAKPSWLELESIISLQGVPSAESVTGLSMWTIRRNFLQLVVALSARRRGMKLRDALAIANGGTRAQLSQKKKG